jgi:hypothetical protein
MRHARLLWLVGATLATGCAPRLTWAPLASLKVPSAERYPKVGAVILEREVTADDYLGRREHHSTEIFHQVVAILTEAGIDQAATFRIPIGEGEELSAFQARTVTPDGKVHLVDASQVFSATSRAGADKDAGDVEHRVFRFPDARVGSLLEVAFAIESPWPPHFRQRRVDGHLPIERFRARLTYSDRLRASITIYNNDAPVRVEKGFGENTFSFEMGPLPAVLDEEEAPSWRETGVWYLARIRGFEADPAYLDWSETWAKAITGFARHADTDHRAADRVVLDPATLARCAGDRACVVDAALAATRDRTRFDGFRYARPRKISDVVASGRASNLEKALLLRHLLASAEVEAELALLTLDVAPAVDKATPNPSAFDHAVVHVPAQPGIAAPVWLDPSCEYCAAGEIPSWDVGSEALAFSGVDHPLGDFEVKARFEPIAGRPRRDSSVQQRLTVSLAPSGDAEVEEVEERRNDSAIRFALAGRDRSPREQRDHVERQLSQTLAGARLRDHHLACDRGAGTCTQTESFTAPGYGALDGARLVVPLTVLPVWGAREPTDERQADVVYRHDHTLEQVVRLRIPPGWTAAELPAAASVKTEAVAARLEVASDGETVTVRRVLEKRAGHYPRASYPEIRYVERTFAGFRRSLVVLTRR